MLKRGLDSRLKHWNFISQRVFVSRNHGACSSTSNHHMEAILFDLDGTLYSAQCGYIEHIRANIFEFMYAKGFVPRDQSAEEVWKPIFKRYNQTMRGLKASGMVFNEEEYWQFHRTGVDKYLSRDEALKKLLQSIPHKKYIFTNCHEKQALEALRCLGVENEFEEIFGASFMGDNCKPEEVVYQKVFDHLGIKDASKVVLFEDSYKNLATASRLGMGTVFIESMTAVEENVSKEDRAILSSILPTLSTEEAAVALKVHIPNLFHT